MGIPQFGILDAIDIAIVAFFVYRVITLLRGTRAVPLLKGLAVILIAFGLSRWLHLRTVTWLLQRAVTMVFVALPIVFMPELRRALEQIGRGRLFTRSFSSLQEEDASKVMSKVVQAAFHLSRNRTGALVVIENEIALSDIVVSGTQMDSALSPELLETIFHNGTPLHDGAVLIRADRIIAAGCLLPLSEEPSLSKDMGTRHRAALGISEQSDALAVIVSEETGTVSVARGGAMHRFLTEEDLLAELTALFKRHRFADRFPGNPRRS